MNTQSINPRLRPVVRNGKTEAVRSDDIVFVSGQMSLDEAYGRLKDGEVWLMGCDIPEYVQANRFNHQPKRPRKLLLHRREIKRFASRAYEKGLTLVPLKMYFKEGKAKVLLGVCKGRKLYDKREVMKKNDVKRDIARAMRRG